VLLRLLAAGLTWHEARSLSMEDALCLLQHLQLDAALDAIEREADRVASLTLVDEGRQHKRLVALELRARGLIDRFYRSEREE
jgi:hypothetical protein